MESPSPANRRARLIGAGIAALLVALFAFQTWRTLSTRPEVGGPPAALAMKEFGIDTTNVAAPAFDLAGLDGSRVSLEASRGQVIFVNFWATWCPPCRDEMPSMVRLGQELSERYPGRFKMIAVSVDEELAPVKEYFSAPPFAGTPPGLTVALDPDQSVTKAYYCTARGSCPDLKFPETYIVDRSGRLVAFVVGPRDWSHPAAKAFLEQLIGS